MSKDTIYREDAIKAINLQVRIPHDVASAQYASMAINAIRSVPSADRPQEDYNRGYCDAVQGIADEMVKQGKYIVQDRPQVNAELKADFLKRQYEAVLKENKRLKAETPQWIPCSERLPQIGQKVLASTKKTVFTQVFKGYYSEPNKWKWEHNSVKTIEAWMPLPTEYKGADDDTN